MDKHLTPDGRQLVIISNQGADSPDPQFQQQLRRQAWIPEHRIFQCRFSKLLGDLIGGYTHWSKNLYLIKHGVTGGRLRNAQ